MFTFIDFYSEFSLLMPLGTSFGCFTLVFCSCLSGSSVAKLAIAHHKMVLWGQEVTEEGKTSTFMSFVIQVSSVSGCVLKSVYTGKCVNVWLLTSR